MSSEIQTEDINLIEQNTLEPGDHISALYDGYHHHGIYEGNGNVIDLVPEAARDEGLFNLLFKTRAGLVRRVRLSTFTRHGAIVTRIIYTNASVTREQVVDTAQAFLQNQNVGYNLTFSNCECVPTFCWTGRYTKINFTKKYQFIDLSHCN